MFERNAQALYKVYTKGALKGNAYAFKELADRAFGKLEERHEFEMHPYSELNEQQMLKRIAELERQLGMKSVAPQLLPAPAGEVKPN